MEEWRDIEVFEGKYMVSNTGKVKNLNYKRTGKEKIMKAYPDKDGYLCTQLCKDGKVKNCRINRLVAQAFIPNPENLPQVNHKNEDKTDNRVENLEWCTNQYNVEYSNAKAVIAVNKVSGLIVEFPSAREAERQTGIDHSDIAKCCKGKLKSAGGFYWIYANSEEVANE